MDGSDCAGETSKARRRPCSPLTTPGGTRNPAWPWCGWPKETWRLAAVSIRDALENPTQVPSKELPPNTELRRAPLLEAQVEIEVAAGDLERARAAADELERVAGKFESKALAASTALAYGRVRLAEGATADAERHFEEAARLWHEVGAPYEAAVARMGLAEAHRARGNARRADSELRAARAVLERIRDVHQRRPSRARRRRSASPISIRAPRLDGFRREGDYWSRHVRRAHGAGAGPQGDALPRPAPRRPRA